MTGRGRELEDIMERTSVDILCLQEGSKAWNIEGGCKLFYNGADKRRNEIGVVISIPVVPKLCAARLCQGRRESMRKWLYLLLFSQ